MAAFNFPDPLVQQTVTNPITGSTYQWKEPPGKWVVISRSQGTTDIIYEGDTPPTPRGEYKLWYSTDTLELYFWYEDTNGTSAWIPTSKPITGLEALIVEVDAAGVDIAQAKREIIENYDDIQQLQTTLNEVIDGLGNVTLQEILENNNVATKGATFGEPVSVAWDAFNALPSHAVPLSIYEDGQGEQDQLIEDNASNISTIQSQISNILDDVPEEVFDVRGKKDVLCTADTGISWNTAVSGELRGIYTSGTVKNANRYVGNWNYAIVVHKDDYNIHGDFASENSNNRGVLEITRNNGSAIIFKGIIKRTYTQDDSLVFLLEHNLFGFGDVLSTDSSSDSVGVGKKCRFYFYTL